MLSGWVAGLLQKRMAFYNDLENVVSAAMTVVQNLMDKYGIDPRSIGRYKVFCALCHLHSGSLYTQHVNSWK